MAQTIAAAERLRNRLAELAAAPVLLVACDYDGTMAPIVADPEQAWPNAATVAALRQLAEIPDTHVAVVSGRSLRDLERLAGLPRHVHMVGSHGSEFGGDAVEPLSAAQRELLAELMRGLSEIAARAPGLSLERKPSGVAFHFRNAEAAAGKAALAAVLAGPAACAGVHLRHGKMVVELSLRSTDKGEALRRLRSRVGATAVAFFGDDVTDEDAFATLGEADVGVKVGPGETLAAYRVGETDDVARLLDFLVLRRKG